MSGTDGAKAPTAGAPDLRSFIERLEAATEGSRELDAEIWLERFKPEWEKTFGPTALQKLAYAKIQAPHYTTSLDAALTLVPGGWVLWNLRQHVKNLGWGEKEWWWVADVWFPSKAHTYVQNAGRTPTPALALCIAALKARMANQGGPTGSPKGVAPDTAEGGEEVTDVAERVAQAAYEAEDGDKTPWVHLYAAEQQPYRAMAIAALTSLLEPTEEMVEAGHLAMRRIGLAATDGEITSIYKAMLSRALEGRG